MPSGSITITPGRTLSTGAVTLSMLNDLGNPSARVDEGSITNRELADGAFSGSLFSDGGVAVVKLTPGTAFQLLQSDATGAAVEWVENTQIKAPAGGILTFGGATTPSGWLDCNGAAVSRVTYLALFTAIGTTYGAGDGTTTFNLPNIAGEIIKT